MSLIKIGRVYVRIIVGYQFDLPARNEAHKGMCLSGTVQFHFCHPGNITSDTGISVEMSYSHRHGNEEYEWKPDLHMPLSGSCSVLLLIGASIVDFHGDPDGTLSLQFTNGDSLTFFDETTMYEAYHIWHGNDPLIVV